MGFHSQLAFIIGHPFHEFMRDIPLHAVTVVMYHMTCELCTRARSAWQARKLRAGFKRNSSAIVKNMERCAKIYPLLLRFQCDNAEQGKVRMTDNFKYFNLPLYSKFDFPA